ncbi:MAG TPA: fibronectin type III domain-containing protein, partial [Chryseosolibacter sp.]
MKRIVGLWVLYLGTGLCAFSQVDTSYIYNVNMPYGVLDLRLAKSPTRYYYLQEGITFSYRESAPGVRTNTYTSMTNWNTSAYGQGNLREVNGTADNFVMNYRLLKPPHYDANYSPGYPIIIMFHGAGESANCWIDERCYWATASYNPVTNSPPAPTDQFHKLLNNDRNLLHGGAQHLTAVNLAGSRLPDDPSMPERAFPGFVLFPQSLNGWGPHTTVEDAIRILRLIIKKYNIDESRVYIHGLSNGGGAVFQALKRAPWLFAAALPMSAVNDGAIINQGMVPEVSKIPLWIFQGGLDINPTPGRTYNVVRNFRDAGGDVRYYLYENLGHGTWNTAYKEPDFFSWMLQKRKYNPHIYYGDPVICNTTQTGVRLGFSKGFFAYEWQRDGQVIPGETGPEITVSTPGTYRGRFSRDPSGSHWERWSEPIVVSEMNPAKPAVQVIGTAHLRGPGLASTDANNTVQLRSIEQAELYSWYKDGSPINFSGTDVDDTLRLATFTSAYSGGNGAYTLVVKNFNCPSPPSDPVNLFFNDSSPVTMSISGDAFGFKGTVSNSSIFLSWNDVSSLEKGYEIWRRKAGTADFRFVAKTAEDAISYLDSGLDPSTTYEYKLRAVNNSGRSNYLPSNDVAVNYSLTTLGDFHYPAPPQALSVVSNTLNSITLSWKDAKDESGIKEYYVYYNSDSISTGSNATTYTLTGLPQNSVYTVTVKAVDHGNHFSQPSNQVIATTYLSGLMYKHSTGAFEYLDDSAMVATMQTPEFTGWVPNFTLQPRTQEDYFNFEFTGYLYIEAEGTYYFTLTSSDGSRLILDGNVIADNDGRHGTKTVASDTVYLTAGPHAIDVLYFDDVGVHNLTVQYKGPGVGDGTTFVTIPDSALRSGNYFPPVPPGAPATLVANGVGMSRVDLSWEFTDDAETDYEVYRSPSEAGPFDIVARATATSVTDSIGLLPGTVYYYKVKTVNRNGTSGFSPSASAETAADGIAPSIPRNLQVISKTLTSVAFSWDPSTDNVAVTGYEIFSGGQLIGTSPTHAFTAENIEPNTQYDYTVRALDATGNRSDPSDPLGVTTKSSALFYSAATGNLNELSTWHRNADGTGEMPPNFSDNGQYFVISNRTSTALGGPWTVGGNASRVILSSGVTLTADQAFSAFVELQGTAVLNLNHTSAPILLKLSPQSTVNFNAYPSIPANTYGSIILSGSTPKTFDPDTTTVLGDLTVNEGLALKGAPHNSSHIRLAGSLTLSGSRNATAADNSVHLEFISGSAQTVSTNSDLHLYRIISGENQVLTVTNPAATPVKIGLGSLNGGGLLLANGSVLNVNNHSIILQDAAVVNPGDQKGRLAMDGGDLSITSTSGQQSNLYFDAAHHRVNYFEVDLSGAGILSIREPLAIAEGIKVKNGTLASGGNITLLATSEQTASIHRIENGGRITGEVAVQQYLEARGTSYRYLSAPVSDVNVAEWQGSFPITGKFSGSSSGAGLPDSPSLFFYREASGGWVAYPPPGGSNTAPIERGVGYAALLRNETNPIILSEKGAPYQGTIAFGLSPSAGGASSDGWNFIGNPFASPILWDNSAEAWTRSGICNVIAMRHNSVVNGQVRSQVVYYDAALGGGIVPQGEAFWVKTFTSSPALSIQEQAKADSIEEVTVPATVRYLVLNLRQGELRDPAYIIFTTGASDGYDPQYDGRKLKNYGLFNLSTLAQDTMRLAINHVSAESCSVTVRLDVANVQPGSYSFSFENMQSLTDIGEMVLLDNFSGTRIAVTGAEYPFTVTSDPNSFGRNRFALVFNKQALDVSTPRAQAADVCAPGPGTILVTDSQTGVSYYAVDENGKPISGEVTGNGQAVELPLMPDVLVAGSNSIRISAGFPGCDRQLLGGAVVVNYVTGLEVTAPADVSICRGEDVTLEASGAPAGGFYKWYDNNGNAIEGASGNTLSVSDVLN